MSIEEDVDIRILDPRKLDAEGRKAIGEMEKIRKRLEAEAKKADKAVKDIGGAPVDILNTQVARGGAFTGPGKIQAETGLAKGIAPILKKSNPFKDLVAKVNGLEERDSVIEKELDGAIEKLSNVQATISNPVGFLLQGLTRRIPSALLKGGVIGTIVVAVASQVFELVKSTFAPGGINDVRKQFLDEASTIPELDNLIAIRNGSIFFTSDVRVRQKVAQSSNTEGLDIQSQRFNEFALGRDISG